MVLLVLAIVWAAVLASWLRSRAARTFGDSVGTFRRHLSILERAAPVTVSPAHSLRDPVRVPVPPDALNPRLRPPAPAGPAGLSSLAPPAAGALVAATGSRTAVGSSLGGRSARRPGPVAGPAGVRRPPSSARRRRVQRRRRRVLTLLAVACLGSLLLGLVPGMHRALYLNVVVDILLAAYLALLVHLRSAAAERDSKLAFLPPIRPVPAGLIRRGTGRYASLAHSLDTGEVWLQQAAN